ncbi:hypothetical protein ACQP0C_41680 (plasmid) [Nocardia sp. CA-129566]|uniref:hypothetical protein n=1 Tax=Nocardia sp. CA-129566 TaxID=3239976 RepID=UPI003D956DC4
MTLLHPFRGTADDEMAELRTQIRRRARRARTRQDMLALVDDMIDALGAVLVADTPPDAGPATGLIQGPEGVDSRWSCTDPGPLTVDEAREVLEEHIDCVPDRALCRIKHTALTVLAAAGIRTPDGCRVP